MGKFGHATKAATIATDATLSSAIFVQGFSRVGLEVPTAEAGLYTATCNIYVQVAQDDSDTFRRLKEQGVYSAGSGILDWEVPSNAGNFFVNVPVEAWNYIKVESRASANSTTFPVKVHLSNLHTV